MSSDTLVSDMGPGELVLVILACGIGALLIGAVGIGGVVILPALLVVGVQPAVGIASIYIAFMPAACAKLLVLGRIRGLIPWRAALSCGSTAAIGAAIGGVLVERTVEEVLPAVQKNRDGLSAVIEKLTQQRDDKVDRVEYLQKKYKIRVRGEEYPEDEENDGEAGKQGVLA